MAETPPPAVQDAPDLADMIANLEGYIERRAAELAAPQIAKAREAALVGVEGARGLQQRAEDLAVELRRQLRAVTRRADEHSARAKAAEAAVDRVRRLCHLTINASCRVQAIEQARDTLAALDREEPSDA